MMKKKERGIAGGERDIYMQKNLVSFFSALSGAFCPVCSVICPRDHPAPLVVLVGITFCVRRPVLLQRSHLGPKHITLEPQAKSTHQPHTQTSKHSCHHPIPSPEGEVPPYIETLDNCLSMSGDPAPKQTPCRCQKYAELHQFFQNVTQAFPALLTYLSSTFRFCIAIMFNGDAPSVNGHLL